MFGAEGFECEFFGFQDVRQGGLRSQLFRPLKRMAVALNQAVHGIRAALEEVRAAADHAAMVSRELSAAGEHLSSGAQEQASSLEETAASLEEMTSTLRQSAAQFLPVRPRAAYGLLIDAHAPCAAQLIDLAIQTLAIRADARVSQKRHVQN